MRGNTIQNFLEFNEEEILHDTGKVSHALAVAFAEKEYGKYVKKRDVDYVSNFDKLLIDTGDIESKE